MNKRILKTLEEYLGLIEDKIIIHDELDREYEIENIKKQIRYIESEIQKEKMRAYVSQLEAFKKHMADTFEKLMGDDCTSDSVDNFYRSDFEINWRGKTVTLANGAEVFQAIEAVIQTEIDDCEEI